MRRLILIILPLLILVSVTLSFVLVWTEGLQVYGFLLYGFTGETSKFFTQYYIKTHLRMSPWFIGMIMGYFVYITKNEKHSICINKVAATVAWIVSFSIMGACIFTVQNFVFVEENYSKLGHALIIAFVCPIWCIAVCWVLFACINGYGGHINDFLSQPIFGVIKKVAFSMYLLNFPQIAITTFRQRQQAIFNLFYMNYMFLGNVCFTILVSIIWVLIFEFPVNNFISLVFKVKDEKVDTQ